MINRNAFDVRRTRRLAAMVAVLATVLGPAAACGGAAPQRAVRAVAPSASMPGTAAPTTPASPTAPPPAPETLNPRSVTSAVVPSGVTAGIAVFDRQAGRFVEQHNATMRFRSASLVKLLIVLDYLWDRGPGYAVAAEHRARLDAMLRSSDDDAATYFWRMRGSTAVVTRMAGRLGLEHTTPPTAPRRGWGSTAVSAADLVRVYRYLLDAAPVPVREYVMGNLRQATRCGTDGFDQSFGIPGAFQPPWAVKQGWYEFGGRPARPCVTTAASAPDVAGPAIVDAAAPAGTPVDWSGEVLHTTGTVGAGDRSIVVVLTLHRRGTPFPTAAAAITGLTGSLRLHE